MQNFFITFSQCATLHSSRSLKYMHLKQLLEADDGSAPIPGLMKKKKCRVPKP